MSMTRVTHRDFTEEELLNPLYEFYVKEGRRPMQKDFKDKIPSTGMIMGGKKGGKLHWRKLVYPLVNTETPILQKMNSLKN